MPSGTCKGTHIKPDDAVAPSFSHKLSLASLFLTKNLSRTFSDVLRDATLGPPRPFCVKTNKHKGIKSYLQKLVHLSLNKQPNAKNLNF